MSVVLSPSDLSTDTPDGSYVLAGRVAHRESAGVVLSDAFAHVQVPLENTACDEGDIVELRVDVRAGRVLCGELIARAVPLTKDAPDVRRFSRSAVGQHLRRRAALLQRVRDHFRERGFLEVETPLQVPSPGLDLHLDAVAADDAFLITSPEYQMKRLLAGGVPRCFQLARCFRRGERGSLHNPEFTMLEWYRAFAGYEDVMTDTEELVRDLARFARNTESLERDGRAIDVSAPFDRIRVAEAFELHAGVSRDETLRLAAEDEDTFFRLMVDAVEPALARRDRPVFLYDFPAPQASLARRCPEDPRFAERFELYVAGVELCNGFGELTDAVEQRERLERDRATRASRGLPAYPIDERFLAALESGLPRCAGNALGVDRLVALCLGASAIGDVQAFPADVL